MNSRWTPVLGLFPALLAAFLPAPSLATTFIDQPFEEAVHDAPGIARVRIGNKSTEWAAGPDGVRRIYTYYDSEVLEAFKGEIPSGRARIRELGGEKDGVGLQVSGAAEFAPGENVVVFVGAPNADKSLDVYGMMMGRYEISKDADGTEYLLGAGAHPAHFPPHPGEAPGGAKSGPVKWTLAALRDVVAKQAAQQGPAAQADPKSSPSPTQVPAQPSAGATAAAPSQASAPEASTTARPKVLSLALGVLVGFALWLWRRRR